MCGRIAFKYYDEGQLRRYFQLKRIETKWTPMANVAPGIEIPVILNETPDVLSMARWGLLPSWSKESKSIYKMNNACCETVFEKPAFRQPIRKQRCLIPANAFYEWQRGADGKQPYLFRLKGQPVFSMAGIWDRWNKNGQEIISCAVLTCGPNRLMEKIHDRMPVIIRQDDITAWLSASEPEAIKKFMKPFDARLMEAFPISKLVNSTANQGEEVMEKFRETGVKTR